MYYLKYRIRACTYCSIYYSSIQKNRLLNLEDPGAVPTDDQPGCVGHTAESARRGDPGRIVTNIMGLHQAGTEASQQQRPLEIYASAKPETALLADRVVTAVPR